MHIFKIFFQKINLKRQNNSRINKTDFSPSPTTTFGFNMADEGYCFAESITCVSAFRFHSYHLPHQRVLGFFQDPYLPGSSSGSFETTCQSDSLCSDETNPALCLAGLPDIVVDGVLQGFYPRDVRVSFSASILPDHDA